MKFSLLKALTTLVFLSSFFLDSNAYAQVGVCKITPIKDLIRLETVIKVKGLVGINPMYSYDSVNLNDPSENAMFVLGLHEPINLEQFSTTSMDFTSPVYDKFSCPVNNVTLILNKEQRLLLFSFIENKNLFFEVTGTIRWSESSIELAGNAVLANVTELSIAK